MEWTSGIPIGRGTPISLAKSPKEQAAMIQLIQEEVEEGTLQEYQDADVYFYNLIFVAMKSSGGYRKIMDCRTINNYAQPKHFKVEDNRTVKEILSVGDWGIKLDLKHAYSHAPVSEEASRWLGCRFQGRNFIQKGMYFGFATAPRVFTHLMRWVLAILRTSMRVVAYLDDFLLLFYSLHEALEGAKKSPMEFTQHVCLTDTQEDYKSKTSNQGKNQIIKERSRSNSAFLIKDNRINSIFYYRRKLNSSKISQFKLPKRSSVQLRRMELKGFIRIIRTGRIGVQAKITTDASQDGFGATLQLKHRSCAAQYLEQDLSRISSNAREMQAVLYALTEFQDILNNRQVTCILIICDNQVTVADIQRKASFLELYPILLSILEIADINQWILKAQRILGEKYMIADHLSRYRDGSDYSLKEDVYNQICKTLDFHPQVNAFATKYYAKSTNYFSWHNKTEAEATDAMILNWSDNRKYFMFPPISLINRIIDKIIVDKLQILLITTNQKTLPQKATLEKLAKRKMELPLATDCCNIVPQFSAAKADIPQGNLIAWLIY
ncbi:MAG: putative reverse transcriptase [Streblomastix strix]|uniref:Putative reverse transcriptase n=1 Tax=Streblomastix strix TaxID=222440 RepID=A0A5J4V8Q1_9EUKA|nr:MAG: putative reverse transcriptase [Streblomastix strix]